MTTVVYVSSADSGEVCVLALDERDGALQTLQTVAAGGMLMPMALRPDRRVLYVARRSEPLAVLAFAIDARRGTLAALGDAPLPHGMAHLATDETGRWLFSASYGGNLLAVSPLDADGRPRAAHQVLPTGPKAHALRVAPGNRFAFATVLGAGEVLQFRFDAETGRLTPNDPSAWAARQGAGPRHIAFHPNGRVAYVLNELDATLDVLALDPDRGHLSPLQTLPTLPPSFTGEPWAAELRLTPDARFLYTSERRSSTLTAFGVDAGGERLAPLGHFATQAQPRGFAITPSGRYLVAAGQLSNAVGVSAIDPASGALRPLHDHAAGRNPNWVEIVELA